MDAVRAQILSHASAENTARAVRGELRHYLAQEDFKFECMCRALAQFERASKWENPPLWDDELGFDVRMFYWPPGFANQAHRHDDWTATGVFDNALTFLTYQETQGGLVVERRFQARAADAGYISSPCIHNVANDSAEPSISLHVFSGTRTATGRGRTHWHGLARSERRYGQGRDVALRALTRASTRFEPSRRLALLTRIFESGSPALKLVAAKAAAPVAPARAAQWLDELAPHCSVDTSAELARLSQRLRASASARASDHAPNGGSPQ